MRSTDATRKIAEEFGVKIIDMPLAVVVEPVRNSAISQCSGDWILIVDADERVPESLARLLCDLPNDNETVAYALPRRNHFLGQWLEHGFWPDYQVRFFRKGAVTWSDNVHEPPSVHGQLTSLPANPSAAIEHPGYGGNLSTFIEKLVRYSSLEAQRMSKTGSLPIWPYLIRRPFGEFYGRYITSEAWRYGMLGLVWSLLMSYYQLLIVVHYWSLNQPSVDPPMDAAVLRRKVRWEAIRSVSKWVRM